MRTTLYIDRELLKEAMRLVGTNKMTEAVNKSLEEFVRRHRIEKLASRIGNTELSLNQTDLEEMRKNE
ncbi:MAG: hypothetical protein PWQ60_1543 [Thermoanaerobacteraceae bacterium]|jgi:Arc/MetJ family transcription regulator|nr:hypothetical protein [Thermoanaerobacteraceae bacterium]